ncbi:jg23956 [Pararge aegeria aegeria]|uniref:Jg23956 protein n=1 Tax=Pararge aegeria aegeria TaxID=348720 RepID=A0A8S4QVC9_9NEOP|nr:jg23956 [Pararge aegeria aegeria]
MWRALKMTGGASKSCTGGPTSNQSRPRGRPRARWRDNIEVVAGPTWTRLATNRVQCGKMEEAFTRRWVPN